MCVENANRSQMAEAFAHFHGGSRSGNVRMAGRPYSRVADGGLGFSKM
jgi:hypothetical protein